MVPKTKITSVALQSIWLKKVFPNSSVDLVRDHSLIWRSSIKPTPLGEEYSVMMEYKIGKPPQVYIVEPKPLALAYGATKLPHVYDQKEQKLCLYLPSGKEWNSSMLLAQTIVPWIYDWLYHYEIWLGTHDDWRGGGSHPSSSANSPINKEKDFQTKTSKKK